VNDRLLEHNRFETLLEEGDDRCIARLCPYGSGRVERLRIVCGVRPNERDPSATEGWDVGQSPGRPRVDLWKVELMRCEWRRGERLLAVDLELDRAIDRSWRSCTSERLNACVEVIPELWPHGGRPPLPSSTLFQVREVLGECALDEVPQQLTVTFA
jgi:hypothetical protein